jgi:hypothetical protein
MSNGVSPAPQAPPPPPPPPQAPPPQAAQPDTSLKDSCTYALDLIKQFLTFSAAGIAFVLGVVTAGKGPGFSPTFVAWSVGLLVASAACGLLSFMCIVGNVKGDQSYNIDDASVKRFAIFQILLFCAGVAVLFLPTFQLAKAQQIAPTSSAALTPSPTHP